MKPAVLALLLLAQEPDAWDALWRSFADQRDPKLRREALERVSRGGPLAARTAARTLQTRAEAVRALVVQLDADDVTEREKAARQLAEHGHAAEPALRLALEGPSAEARARARAILQRIDERRRSGIVTDPYDDVVVVLGRAGGREHLKLVAPLFSSESSTTKQNAIEAARRLATSDDLEVFEPLLRDRDETVRGRAPFLLEEVGCAAARGRLLRILREETSPGVLQAAGASLARIPGAASPDDRVALLRRAAGSKAPLRGRLLLETVRLHRGPGDPLDGEIERALFESDLGTKSAVVRELPPDRASLAAPLLGDRDSGVRALASRTLDALLRGARPPLFDVNALARMGVESRDPVFRGEVRVLLYRLGGRDGALVAAAAAGDGEFGADAALRLSPEDASRAAPVLRTLRDRLPAGRSRDIVEAALAGEDAAPAVLRLLVDPDPVVQSLALRAAARLRLASAVPRLRDIMAGPLDAVTGVAFDAAGKTLYALGGERSLLSMDLETGRFSRSAAAAAERPASFALSAERSRALSGHEDGSITLWSLDPPGPVRTWKGHAKRVSAVSFAPDGRSAVAGSHDGSLVLWDVEKAERVRVYAADGPPVTAAAISRDGRRLVSAGHGKGLVLWDVTSGESRREYPQGRNAVLSIAFTDSGYRAVAGGTDGSIVLWDLEEYGSTQLGEGHRAQVVSLAVSPDGQRVLSGSVDGSMVLRDAGSGETLRSFAVHSSWVNAVDFSPDGRRAASGGQDAVVAVWDLGTGAPVRAGGRADVRDLARQALVAVGDEEAARALLELLPSVDPRRRAELAAAVASMPLVRAPKGVDLPPDVAKAIERRREVPRLLAGAAGAAELALAGFERLRYRFVKGEPPQGDDAFADDGAVRLSEDLLPALAARSHAGVLAVLLRNSGLRETPEVLRKMIGEGSHPAASACLDAGLRDVLPGILELGEVPAARAARADPRLAREAIGRWAGEPLDDAKIRRISACVAALPDRVEVLFRLAAHGDRRLAMSAAQHLNNARSREVFDEARARHRDGRLPDAQVLVRIIDPDLTPDDREVLRAAVRAGGTEMTLSAYRLLGIGGPAEVELVLPVFARTAGTYLGSVAPHVGPEHRGLIEKLLAAPETKDPETLRYLLLRAGKTEGAEALLEAPPRGPGPSFALVHAVETLKDEALVRKAAGLAERWTDEGTRERIWVALLGRDAPLSARQVEAAVAAAKRPELRGPLLGWIARHWAPELKGAALALLAAAGAAEVEGPIRALQAARPAEASELVLESLGPLLRNRASLDVLVPVLSGPGDGKAVAAKLLEVHRESMKGIMDLHRVHLVLASACGRSDPGLVELLRLYAGSARAAPPGGTERVLPIESRLLAAQSLAASSALAEETVRKLAASAHPGDRAVAAHFRFCRGSRLVDAEWAALPPSEASLPLGVESRVPAAAREALEGYRNAVRPGSTPYPRDLERFAAAFELLTCREWAFPRSPYEKDYTARRNRLLLEARDWLLGQATRSFDESLAAALRDSGYPVGESLGPEDAAEFVRALRDRRGPLAANALWALHRWAPDGPKRIEAVSAVGVSGWTLRATAPAAEDAAAWEKWKAGR